MPILSLRIRGMGHGAARPLYFRDDERTVFGVLRFERAKDNPYRTFASVTRNIMSDSDFRLTLLDEATKRVWKGR